MAYIPYGSLIEALYTLNSPPVVSLSVMNSLYGPEAVGFGVQRASLEPGAHDGHLKLGCLGFEAGQPLTCARFRV